MGLGGMGRRINGIFVLILVLGAVLRLKGVTNPYLDDQSWRQADTASMALNMLGHLGDFPDVFFPMLNYDGAGPQPVELEFPFLPYLLAWTWALLGWQDLWGRLWGICFSLLTLGGIYKFGKLALSERAGLWAAAFYAFIPLTTYYGRVVMPEPVAQAFSIWALVAIFSWRRNPTWIRLLGASILMSGAILAKLPQLMIFPVALMLGFYPFQRRLGKILVYSFLSLLLPMLYYSWVHLGAGEASQFVSGILSHQVMEGPTSYAEKLYKNLKYGLGLPILLALMGIALMVRKKVLGNEVHLGLILWSGISGVYLVVVCLKIPLDYYLIPLALPMVLLTGYTLDTWGGDSEGNGIPAFVVGALLVGLLWVNQILYYESKYQWDERLLTQAQWIRQHTEENSVLILSGSQPMTLYYSQRYGYRLIRDDLRAWLDLQELPGDYLVALPDSRGEDFWKRIESAYTQVGPGVYQIKDQQ
ncbi:PMT family glycosyltransferase, 4-amino-4-deoxy-L-arabinose transferase [Desulfitobacterium dehalogenans ATCC 51507]|uniref:PMT family glycosyltransferase, 4-amino-4-deoxy-L-arabinose transferase n=1 Tax=Desulfitobacterium dehalogenans (strain ATCC 51507 / DSM 9161 / JW/IU-DC1) TaxID=756499 RepID=I4AB24_DESDJ|nr:glycosyltransferase family 39 protein [Desulfitobacterium dehalogenans]AFM01159.1 PMT family glycosyltransferase, 4-amino-4-deoxy-L-arabinose transferase [Desulfitobacterium dehalogenans ATCC 51507]